MMKIVYFIVLTALLMVSCQTPPREKRIWKQQTKR